MTSQLPHFRGVFLHLVAEKKTLKTGQLSHHYGPSYFVITLVHTSDNLF